MYAKNCTYSYIFLDNGKACQRVDGLFILTVSVGPGDRRLRIQAKEMSERANCSNADRRCDDETVLTNAQHSPIEIGTVPSTSSPTREMGDNARSNNINNAAGQGGSEADMQLLGPGVQVGHRILTRVNDAPMRGGQGGHGGRGGQGGTAPRG